MAKELSFREQVIEKFRAALGDPEVLDSKSGSIYRWTLERGRYDISMYITIDSPEWPEMAHVMISDGNTFQADPVVSITLYTPEETAALIERIIKQWKAPLQNDH